jgi:hypothetical protein
MVAGERDLGHLEDAMTAYPAVCIQCLASRSAYRPALRSLPEDIEQAPHVTPPNAREGQVRCPLLL